MNRLLVTTPPGSPQCPGLLLRDREWEWAGVQAVEAAGLAQDQLRLSHTVPEGFPFPQPRDSRSANGAVSPAPASCLE